MVINHKRMAVEVAFTQEYSKGIKIHGERVWTIKESSSSRDNKNMVGEGREDSRMDWTKDKVRSNSNAYFGCGFPLVCQDVLGYSPTTYPNMEGY